jgi:glycosyltransferase involved in cell wall biosynthesis
MSALPPRVVIFSRHYSEYCFRYANGLAQHARVVLMLDREDAATQWDVAQLPRRPNLTIEFADLRMRRGGLLSLGRLMTKMVRLRPVLIHFQEIPDVLTPLQIWVMNLFTTTVLTVHDPLVHSGRDARLPSLLFRMRDFGRRRAQLLVVHGRFCHEALARAYPSLADRIVQSEHGVLMVPSVYQKPLPREILFFGRMEAYKGLDVVYDAIRILIARGVAHRITIAGRGPAMKQYRDALTGLATTRVIDRFVSASETSRLFQEAAVVILPYKDATQSGVLGAAFGNHRPVIASGVGGLPDVVEDGVNGLLIPPGQPTALADALQRFLEDEALQLKLTEGAERTCASQLHWDLIATELLPKLRRGAEQVASSRGPVVGLPSTAQVDSTPQKQS